MPLLLSDLGPCPICGAAVAITGPIYRQHIKWHDETRTNLGPAAAEALHYASHAADDDDAPTVQFPPIRETVLRRPPPPAVRELRGAELLMALAEELAKADRDGDDLDHEPAAACEWTNPDPAAAWPKTCDYPDSSPCRAYGAPGCRMKAEEGR